MKVILTENVRKAMEYAVSCHWSTNHLYDEHPYEFHLSMSYEFALKYAHLLPVAHISDILSAVWCHDVIEDTRQTYNDVLRATNKEVADLVYAVTANKGRNRLEREGYEYYRGIRMQEYATFVKLCDRLANVKYSKESGSPMFEMYKKEYKYFKDQMYWSAYYKEMFDELDSFLL